jgi:hypothetical protein
MWQEFPESYDFLEMKIQMELSRVKTMIYYRKQAIPGQSLPKVAVAIISRFTLFF